MSQQLEQLHDLEERPPVVEFRPYVYELTEGAGPPGYRYALWLCLWLPVGPASNRSVLLHLVAAADTLAGLQRLRAMRPDGWTVLGRGDPDPAEVIESWMQEPPE